MDIARQSQCSPLLVHVVSPHATLSSSNHDFHRELVPIITCQEKEEARTTVDQPIDRSHENSRTRERNLSECTMQSPFRSRFLFFYFDPSFLILALPSRLSFSRTPMRRCTCIPHMWLLTTISSIDTDSDNTWHIENITRERMEIFSSSRQMHFSFFSFYFMGV